MIVINFILTTVIIQAASGQSASGLTMTPSSPGGTTIKPVLTAEAPGAHKAEVAPESAITGASGAQYAWPYGYFGHVNAAMPNMIATAPPPEGGTELGDATEAQREYLASQQNGNMATLQNQGITLPLWPTDPYANWPGLYGPVPIQRPPGNLGPMLTTMTSAFGTPPGTMGMGPMGAVGPLPIQNGSGVPEAATEANDAAEALKESTASSVQIGQNAANPYQMTGYPNQMFGNPNMMNSNLAPMNSNPPPMNSNPAPMNNNPAPMNNNPAPMNSNPNPMNENPNQNNNNNNNYNNPFQRFYETYMNMLFGPALSKNFGFGAPTDGAGSMPVQNPWLTSYLFREMF